MLLLRELSNTVTAVPVLLDYIPRFAELAMIDDFKNSIHLAENVFKSLT